MPVLLCTKKFMKIYYLQYRCDRYWRGSNLICFERLYHGKKNTIIKYNIMGWRLRTYYVWWIWNINLIQSKTRNCLLYFIGITCSSNKFDKKSISLQLFLPERVISNFVIIGSYLLLIMFLETLPSSYIVEMGFSAVSISL